MLKLVNILVNINWQTLRHRAEQARKLYYSTPWDTTCSLGFGPETAGFHSFLDCLDSLCHTRLYKAQCHCLLVSFWSVGQGFLPMHSYIALITGPPVGTHRWSTQGLGGGQTWLLSNWKTVHEVWGTFTFFSPFNSLIFVWDFSVLKSRMLFCILPLYLICIWQLHLKNCLSPLKRNWLQFNLRVENKYIYMSCSECCSTMVQGSDLCSPLGVNIIYSRFWEGRLLTSKFKSIPP